MTAAEPIAVEVRDLRKSFGSNDVLRGVDLRIERGETFTILGGSGTGKSVILKHLIGLMRPDAGEIRVLGAEVHRLRESQLVEVRRRCGMVFQGAALFDSLTVYENVAYPLREHRRWGEAEVAERVRQCLASVALPGIESLLPAELSGGMRKRVGVARAIALEPELILYDEPTTGLDPANSRRIGALIKSLSQEMAVTSVVVTHDLELCFDISDRVALLKGGRIAAQGTAGELRSSEQPEVRAYFAGDQDDVRDAPRGASGSPPTPGPRTPDPRTPPREGR